jgi:hypothetical protein
MPALLFGLALFAACARDPQPPPAAPPSEPPPASVPAVAPPATDPSPAVQPADPAVAPPAAEPVVEEPIPEPPPGEFGIPDCDDYIRRFEGCLEHRVPPDARENLRAAFEETRAAWRRAAATESGRGGLAAGCRQAAAMARLSMTAYGCNF